jgi:hypothetical protein
VGRAPITFQISGRFNKTTGFLTQLNNARILSIMNRYGSRGVLALSEATPRDSGKTANSWYYTVGQKDGQYWIDFHNSNLIGTTPVAILIQYGHGTKNGGYVQGRDFINPSIGPIFDEIKDGIMKEVFKR